MAPIGRCDELGIHADPMTGPAHAAFEDVGDVECLGDSANILVFALEREGRRPGDDLQPGDVRQLVDDLLGETVAEILIVRIGVMLTNGSTATEG